MPLQTREREKERERKRESKNGVRGGKAILGVKKSRALKYVTVGRKEMEEGIERERERGQEAGG